MIYIFIGLGILVLFLVVSWNQRGRLVGRRYAVAIRQRRGGLLRTISLVIVALSLVTVLSFIGVFVIALVTRPFDSPGYQPDGSAMMGFFVMSFMLSVGLTIGLLKPLTSRR